MKHSYSILHRCLAAMLAGIACLSIGSCADDNISNQQEAGDLGATVSFEVSTAQENRLSQPQSAPATRAAIIARQQAQGLSSEDLATRRLEVQGLPNTCLIETTTEGINAVLPQSGTRASVKTAIDARFSSLGYRSATAGFTVGRPEWFYSAPTNAAGTLVTPLQWAWAQRYARFYAVYPEATTANGIALSPATYSGTPYLDFEVKSNITDQVDLMVACSGEVEYATRHQAPKTNLEFYHALTAVKIAVGQNLSWNKHITKVELRNACSKGRLQLTDSTNGKGLQWTVDAGSKTNFSLTLGTPGISTSSLPNQVLVGKDNDSYTFYMLPQALAGITLHIEFSDAADINIPLSGTWRPATTRTYKLSNTTSNWNYSFTVTSPTTAAAYNETNGGTYTVESFRTDPSDPSVKHAVGWKIVGYEEYNYATNAWEDKGMNKPDWLEGLSNVRTQTENYTAADQGQATIKKMPMKDLLKERNDALKLGPKGSSTHYYDLSMHDIKGTPRGTRSTANCYVISHPGFYKLPLVYGNAITNGINNTASYTYNGSLTDPNIGYVLKNFKDHNGQNITDPWIEKTNGGANNGIDGAQIVWEDEKDLVHFAANPIERSGNETYLKFEVKAADIKNGNAVVAVKKGNTIVWSWHLWFAPDYVLDPIPVVNRSTPTAYIYNFSTENLGWKYTSWNGSAQQQPRRVKVRIQQLVSHQPGNIIITQNPGSTKEGSNTFYQYGRKDAFPGGLTGNTEPTLYPAGHLFNKNAGDNNISIPSFIQNPGSFYVWGANGAHWFPHSSGDPAGYSYYNLWSANNTTTETVNTGNDLPVIKTIYDPSPVGFHLPANNAFTRFTTTGRESTKAEEMNVQGTKDWNNFSANFGWNVFTDGSNTSTIYFPASGWRGSNDGSLVYVKFFGFYWSAVPGGVNFGCYLDFGWNLVRPLYSGNRSWGYAVRPVTE